MRSILWGAAVLVASAMAQPASAQTVTSFYTGKDVLDQCKTDRKWCTGYIMGVVDGVTSYASYTKSRQIFCIPSGPTAGEITDAVIAYLKTKPDLQYDASSYVMLALHDAYPCSKS